MSSSTISLRNSWEVEPQRSEYEMMVNKVSAFARGRPLEGLTSGELTSLAEQTGIDRTDATMLQHSIEFARATNLPSAVFYAMLRKGLSPEPGEQLELQPDMLRQSLEEAVESKLIPPVGVSLESILEQFERLHTERTPLRDLAPTLGLQKRRKIFAQLAQQEIHTLADLRRAGGLDRIPRLRVNDTAIPILEAHAQLSLLPSDLKENTQLVEAGYLSLVDVAETPREEFVTNLRESISTERLTALHAAASVQTRYLANMVTEMQIRAATSTPTPLHEPLSAAVAYTCGCKDCEQAISPLAYFADLLDYALHHVRYQGKAVDLPFLESRFHQPFGALLAGCDLVNKQIRQVRIAIEVLRQHLPTADSNYTAHPVLVEAYTQLLVHIGTSFDEIRRVPSMEKAALRRLVHAGVKPPVV